MKEAGLTKQENRAFVVVLIAALVCARVLFYGAHVLNGETEMATSTVGIHKQTRLHFMSAPNGNCLTDPLLPL